MERHPMPHSLTPEDIAPAGTDRGAWTEPSDCRDKDDGIVDIWSCCETVGANTRLRG